MALFYAFPLRPAGGRAVGALGAGIGENALLSLTLVMFVPQVAPGGLPSVTARCGIWNYIDAAQLTGASALTIYFRVRCWATDTGRSSSSSTGLISVCMILASGLSFRSRRAAAGARVGD